jgi:Ca-activated chloride channel family protein
LEATYIFPLLDRAAVTRFRMEVGGRIVEGTLKERGAARQEYEEAVLAGHSAAIAEVDRPGMFALRVGNLPPGEAATIRLTLVGPLAFDGGEVTFRFPLVVAPRYIPGLPLPGTSVGDGVAVDTDAVPDASRISPPVLLAGYPNPVRFSLRAEVKPSGMAVSDFKSSLHTVVTSTLPSGEMSIEVAPGERLNRDFILRYRVGANAIESSLTVAPDDDPSSEEGTFALTLVPPAGAIGSSLKPRAITFVLDRSGSMAGWKMVAARRALGRMIDSLTDRDRFFIVAFDDTMEIPPENDVGMVPATDRNRCRAIEWLATIEARGGTEMVLPLQQTLCGLQSEDCCDRALVLLTDGQVGNEDQILQTLAGQLNGIRIFTLGIDRAVNEGFLRRLAALGAGLCDVVESEERLDEVMAKVQRRIGSPILTGLRFAAEALDIDWDSVVPATLPDLFPGVPLTVMGRCRRQSTGSLTVTASDDAGRLWQQTVPLAMSRNSALAPLWARGRLRDLEDRWTVGSYGEPHELEQTITALSLRFGVLCRFTAFVAVDRSRTANEGGSQAKIVQPVEWPDGWEQQEWASGGLNSTLFAESLAMPEDIECPAQAIEDEASGTPHQAMGRTALDDTYSSMPVLRRLARPLASRSLSTAFSVEDLNLTAYRTRASEMLAQWWSDTDRTHAFGVLRLQLEALVDDLHSVGAHAKIVLPLAALLEELNQMQLATDENGAASKIENVLRSFVKGEPAVA